MSKKKQKVGFINEKGGTEEDRIPLVHCPSCGALQSREMLAKLLVAAYDAGKEFVALGLKPFLEKAEAEKQAMNSELVQLRQTVQQYATALVNNNESGDKIILELQNIFEKKKFKKQIKYDAEGRITNIEDV